MVGHKRSDGRNDELMVVFGNVQSVINKMDELKAMVAVMKPDILALTETWTHEGIGREIVEVEGYEVAAREDRNDTEKGRGGGIIIYVNKMHNVRRIEENRSFNQSASIEMKNGCEDVKIHVIYRSPNSTKANDDDLCNWQP